MCINELKHELKLKLADLTLSIVLWEGIFRGKKAQITFVFLVFVVYSLLYYSSRSI